MQKITPIIETRTKVIHAFSCVIYRGQGEIIEYSKTFKAPPGTFSSLDDIKEYIRQCEQKRLDLEDAETWSKAYLPETATYNSKGVYEGRVRFTSVSTKNNFIERTSARVRTASKMAGGQEMCLRYR